MKSAEEWAGDAARFCWGSEAADLSDEAVYERVAAMFAEHARDQRHVVAELEMENDVLPVTREDAHRIAMNAPAPGES